MPNIIKCCQPSISKYRQSPIKVALYNSHEPIDKLLSCENNYLTSSYQCATVFATWSFLPPNHLLLGMLSRTHASLGHIHSHTFVLNKSCASIALICCLFFLCPNYDWEKAH